MKDAPETPVKVRLHQVLLKRTPDGIFAQGEQCFGIRKHDGPITPPQAVGDGGNRDGDEKRKDQPRTRTKLMRGKAHLLERVMMQKMTENDSRQEPDPGIRMSVLPAPDVKQNSGIYG